jgi:hypothetical protein
MTDRKRMTVLLPLISVLMLSASCGGGGGFHDLDGKFEAAKDGDDTIYRLKWDNHTLAVLNTAKADFASVLLALRQAQQSVKFVEKESGEKLPEVVLIELIDSESTAFKGAGKFWSDKITIVLWNGFISPSVIVHEMAHILPVSKLNQIGFFSEGRARYFHFIYIDKYLCGNTNSFDSIIENMFYHTNYPSMLKKINQSPFGIDEEMKLLVDLSIKGKFIEPIDVIIKDFRLRYGHTLYSSAISRLDEWMLNYYASYSYAFCGYLIQRYGLNTFLQMMKKDIALPLPDNYLDILMGEFYHKPLSELETEFTNYIMHYEYKNQYLKDPAIRQELEDYYMKWKDKAEHMEVSTNKTEK